MTKDEIIQRLDEPLAYVQMVNTHGSVIPTRRREILLEWADEALRRLAADLEGAAA